VEYDVGWRPGSLDRLRAFGRRALSAVVGPRGEELVHGAYHRFLRRIGRFGPPEDATTIAVLTAIARRSATIIDVGANVGRYAWFLRRYAQPHATVFAIEPHPGAAKLLRESMGNVQGYVVLEVAAAERDAGGDLIVPVGAFGSPVSGLAWVRGGESGRTGSLPVALRRIDSLIEEGAITIAGPVFMKIDVEGGEGGVFRGARGLLERHRPMLYFECQAASLARQGETPESIWGDLGRAGYRMFGVRAGRLVPMSEATGEIINYFAIPDVGADLPEPLDTAVEAMLNAWAERTRRDGPRED